MIGRKVTPVGANQGTVISVKCLRALDAFAWPRKKPSKVLQAHPQQTPQKVQCQSFIRDL